MLVEQRFDLYFVTNVRLLIEFPGAPNRTSYLLFDHHFLIRPRILIALQRRTEAHQANLFATRRFFEQR